MAHWQFRPLNPNETSGASTVDDNFADEERTSIEILVRETLQNPLDARQDDSEVRVRYSIINVDTKNSEFTNAVFSGDWAKHFSAGGLVEQPALPSKMCFLVIEDFGTTGLQGCFSDSSKDGRTENWNAFWFREGEGAKPKRSNGGAGQGKITLYLASRLRSVFALTRRSTDAQELLFGCCRFKRNYKIAGDARRWAKEARWCATEDPSELAVPITNARLIDAAKRDLGLARNSKAGTSFIVPMPIDEIDEDSLLEAVINEFFFAIRRGRLVVQVGNRTLNAESISREADGLGPACRLPKRYRNFLELAVNRLEGNATAEVKSNWSKKNELTEAAFSEVQLSRLRETFEKCEPVCVDFPVLVRERDGEVEECSFRVILQRDEDSDQSQELFVRQDLAIDGEKRLRTARVLQPVMALTFIEARRLSGLLVAAEEPTHRHWNAKRAKVNALYKEPDKALSAVRNAAFRLLKFISPDGKRDETALASYFSDPATSETAKKGAAGALPDSDKPAPDGMPDIPLPLPKPIRLMPLEDGFAIKAVAGAGRSKGLPLSCEVEVAYATTLGDAFKLWDAADFWLNDAELFPITSKEIGELERDGNTLEFKLLNENAELKITGFDQRRRLDVRVKYREVADGADFEDN